MSSRQYTDEFKAEAIKQVIERGFTVVEVAARIGVPKHTLYGWVQAARKVGRPSGGAVAAGVSSDTQFHALRRHPDLRTPGRVEDQFRAAPRVASRSLSL